MELNGIKVVYWRGLITRLPLGDKWAQYLKDSRVKKTSLYVFELPEKRMDLLIRIEKFLQEELA